MKIIKFFLYVAMVLLAILAAMGLFAKKGYKIERSIEIDAPRSVVYEQIRLFKNQRKWSPWNDLDSTMQVIYSGTDGEAGATMSWNGNEEAGEGRQTIKSIDSNHVDIHLDIKRPIQQSMPASYQISQVGDKTKVSFTIEPTFPFPINVWAMLTDTDKAMGKDYERGLGYLKKLCEKIVRKKYRGYDIEASDIPVKYYVGSRAVVPFADMNLFMDSISAKSQKALLGKKITLAGSKSGLFWMYNDTTGTADMAAAYPIEEEKKFGDGVMTFTVGGTKALVIEHLGSYEKTIEAHGAMEDYMKEKKLKPIIPIIEEYVTDTTKEPDTAKWLTKVIYFVKPDSVIVPK